MEEQECCFSCKCFLCKSMNSGIPERCYSVVRNSFQLISFIYDQLSEKTPARKCLEEIPWRFQTLLIEILLLLHFGHSLLNEKYDFLLELAVYFPLSCSLLVLIKFFENIIHLSPWVVQHSPKPDLHF